jgi:hypothetical protein
MSRIINISHIVQMSTGASRFRLFAFCSPQAEKDRFVNDLPARFASLQTEHQAYLTGAELRLVNARMAYEGTAKTRAAVIADIRKRVHSSRMSGGRPARWRMTPGMGRNIISLIAPECWPPSPMRAA